jgi:alanyl-tRNA synthetase
VSSERLYYDDAYTVRFDADVIEAGTFMERPAVELDRTFFYPESGGQLGDRGSIGGRAVVDVQAEGSRVWHLLEAGEAVPGGPIGGVVDWERRFDFMQQHTGQHVLSAAFERVLEAPTLSSRLGETQSTIEVGLHQADWRMVDRVEGAANRILWENRPVERHWVDAKGLERFRLRKPPPAHDRIRIVEVPDWDVSACGGTHTRSTGEVGLVKVVGWERVRGNIRFAFQCGRRALEDHAWRTEALIEAAKRRTLGDRELLDHLEGAAEERDRLRKQLGELQAEALAREARDRVGAPPSAVAEFSAARPRADVRTFALKCLEAGAPWVVAGAAGPEPVVIVGRAKSGGVDLRSLLPRLLELSGGKGGGSADFLQLGARDAAAAERTQAWAAGELRRATSS